MNVKEKCVHNVVKGEKRQRRHCWIPLVDHKVDK